MVNQEKLNYPVREVEVVSVQTELDEKQARVTELIKRVAKVMGLQKDMMEMKEMMMIC